MQSFSFRSNYDENQNIERIITERNRKLAKQQIIFTIILIILALLFLWYLFKKIVYTDFDGYVQTEYVDYRAVDDLYLFEQFRDVGDIVVPGDTLYSYVYLSNILGVTNLNSEPNVVINDRNLRLQTGIAYTDANVLRVRIAELEKQIEKEDNNIRFGLTDNSHKMDLERELAEARETLNALLNKVGIYNNIRRETSYASQRFGQYNSGVLDTQSDMELLRLYENNPAAIRYAVAKDTSVVTKLWSPPFSRVFKEEHILQLETLSLENSNMQVVAYVPTGDMNKINNNTQAEVIVNDDVSFTASVQLLGARTEDLPEELRNSLSHTYTTVMVVFRPDAGQTLPLWAVVDHVPVTIRIKNFDNGRREDGSDYWYITHKGLTEETKRHLGLLPASRDSVPAVQTGTIPVDMASGVTDEKSNALSDTSGQSVHLIEHKVKEGDNLHRLSAHYGVSIEEIVKYNPGVEKVLLLDAVLQIPSKNQGSGMAVSPSMSPDAESVAQSTKVQP